MDRGEDEQPNAPDVVIQLLANPRQRHVLHVLRERETLHIDTLGEIVAAREHEIEREHVPPTLKREVTISLHHRELPRLDDYRVIDYHPNEGKIRVGPTFPDVERYLEDVFD